MIAFAFVNNTRGAAFPSLRKRSGLGRADGKKNRKREFRDAMQAMKRSRLYAAHYGETGGT